MRWFDRRNSFMGEKIVYEVSATNQMDHITNFPKTERENVVQS